MSKNRGWLVATVAALVACGGTTVTVSPVTDGGEDARSPAPDGMSSAQGDSEADSGTAADTAPGDDTGIAEDSVEPADTEPPDSAMGLDSGPVDTGTLDTGTLDTGTRPADTGTMPDTRPFDTGVADTGHVSSDTGTPEDTGVAMDSATPVDSAPADTGGAMDTGSDTGADTGGRDTGTVDAPTCPSTANGACSDVGQMCEYSNEVCYCSYGAPVMTTATWHCFVLASGCPLPEPAVGSACTQMGLVCNYGACEGGNELLCVGGKWTEQMGFCPP